MNLSFSELIFLFVLGLLLFGPKKLPEIGRQLGRFMAEFKRASNEFQAQLSDEVRKLEMESAVDNRDEKVKPSGQISRGQLLDLLTGEVPSPKDEAGAVIEATTNGNKEGAATVKVTNV